MVSIPSTGHVYDLLRHSTTGSTHLYLARHGQTEGNRLRQLIGHTDVPLDDLGLAQARQVGEHMRTVELDAVISSPLQRARVTAEEIARHHDLTVEIDHRLREMHFGHVEGLTIAEAVARHPEIAILQHEPDHPDFAWPGGDVRRAFHEAVLATFTDLALTHLDRHVAIVCHGGVIGSFIAQLDGGSPNDYDAYPIANCSVTHLEVHAEGTTRHRYNDVAHLEAVSTEVFTFASETEPSAKRGARE
jgi:2,3-bisphosphoglycerate-dependent phosphoglycerate mutase